MGIMMALFHTLGKHPVLRHPLKSAVMNDGFVLCLMTLIMAEETPQSEASLQSLSAAINSFSISLYKILSEEPGNLVVSPFSVEVAVGMLLEGLGGETAQHVADAAQLPEKQSRQEKFKEILSSLQSAGNVSVMIANKIYVEKTFNVKEEFLQSTEMNFHSSAEQADFRGNPEGVRTDINEWVSTKTNGKISQLLEPNSVDENTVMALVNAIYFKGIWGKPFEEDLTDSQPFHVDSQTSKNVRMMHDTGYYMLGDFEDLKAKVLQLPYQGREFSMLIFLPNHLDDFQHLHSNIGTRNISNVLSGLRGDKVSVSLPRFKITSSLDLIPPLSTLGMTEIFTPGGDFSGMTDVPNLYVSKAIQKAFIQVNEGGTEASAATAILLAPGSAPGIPKSFTVDRPFIYMIVNVPREIVMFIGRVADP